MPFGIRISHKRLGAFPTVIVLAVAGYAVAQGGEPETVKFETHIAPLLQTRCVKCHGEGKLEAGLDVRRKFTLAKGGDSGAAFIEGKPEESLLVTRVEKGEMPPADEGALTEAQRGLFRRWIAAGAPLDKSPERPLEEADAVARFSEADRQFWAFQPPRRPSWPVVASAAEVRGPIDLWLRVRLAERGLTFAIDAPHITLLRRLCFDLTGLPPTIEQIETLADEAGPDAVERLVDRLLASPRYGERWGRHWLDIAGYADSDGYLAADRLRPEAWRYRDYVIDAHNRDLPFDQFVREQLAGDEMSDWRAADELTPEVVRQLTATGFLRTASDPTYVGYTEPNEIHQVVSDTMQIFGSAFLGLTIHCARCHSHKFDPLSQRDYYSLQAVFLPALDPARWQPSEVRGIPLATNSQAKQITAVNQKATARVGELNNLIAELTTRYRQKRVREALLERPDAKADAGPAMLVESLTAALVTAEAKRTEDQKKLIAQYPIQVGLAEADLTTRYPDFRLELERIKAVIAAESTLVKNIERLRGLSDLDGPLPEGRILRRGDYNKPGAVVSPGVPEVLAPTGFDLAVAAANQSSGRRTALARWLTSPENPLLARVQVNRMWARHFDRALVATQANFGRSGTKPTHPELLDWLATELPRMEWSLKRMHREMLTSTAYRQSSDADELKAQRDPRNELYGAWQPRRHDGETLRDSVLAVAGKLNTMAFGRPSAVQPQGDGSVLTADDAAGNRRSIYLIVRRSQHLTMLDLFDTPMMEVNCPERQTSTVPLQALALLHGPFAERSAVVLGERLWRVAETDSARIDFAYQLLFARAPTPTQRQAIEQFLGDVAADQLGSAASNATAETREKAARAAWTQLALVLLNSNEFVYVD